jgi:hypothetical protein
MLAMPALVTSYGARVGLGISELTEDEPIIDEPGFMWGKAALVR